MFKFITGRTKAIFYSIKGAYLLLKTEHSIQAQSVISILFIVAGFYFDISQLEWMFQILAICLVLTAESLNSAIEKIADFIHPDYNKKIGFIKDIAAGAVFFAAVFALFVIYSIYL
jgi:diacylglycerol kinase (ATP)|tara:strand:- start:1465 stop:1812 length:348 start_codon:yes stop_codon:yes gene_type:complete